MAISKGRWTIDGGSWTIDKPLSIVGEALRHLVVDQTVRLINMRWTFVHLICWTHQSSEDELVFIIWETIRSLVEHCPLVEASQVNDAELSSCLEKVTPSYVRRSCVRFIVRFFGVCGKADLCPLKLWLCGLCCQGLCPYVVEASRSIDCS